MLDSFDPMIFWCFYTLFLTIASSFERYQSHCRWVSKDQSQNGSTGEYHDISKPRNQNRHAATQSVGRLLSTNRDLRLESFVGRESFVQGIDIFYIFSFGVTVFASKKTESMKSGALLPYCWVPPARVHSSGYPVAGTRMRKAVMSRCGSDREHIKVTFFFGILQFYKKVFRTWWLAFDISQHDDHDAPVTAPLQRWQLLP